MSFSDRLGFGPKRTIQLESIDDRLRNRLWEAINYYFTLGGAGAQLGLQVWTDHLARPKDQFFRRTSVRESYSHDYGKPIYEWYQKSAWYEVYDLIEYLANVLRDYQSRDGNALDYFTKICNEALEKERAGYRLQAGLVVPLTDVVQLQAVQDALAATVDRFAPVHEHLKTALGRLSDRPEPDVRNSMKESISAIETLARVLTNQPRATLGEALKTFEKKGIHLHRALNDAWQKIYGYTSDEEGVRHGLFEGATVGIAEARYLLVSCSAFVYYLIELEARS